MHLLSCTGSGRSSTATRLGFFLRLVYSEIRRDGTCPTVTVRHSEITLKAAPVEIFASELKWLWMHLCSSCVYYLYSSGTQGVMTCTGRFCSHHRAPGMHRGHKAWDNAGMVTSWPSCSPPLHAGTFACMATAQYCPQTSRRKRKHMEKSISL